MKLILAKDYLDAIGATMGMNVPFYIVYNEETCEKAIARMAKIDKKDIEIVRTEGYIINQVRPMIEDALVDAGFTKYNLDVKLHLISKDKMKETIIYCSRVILDVIGIDIVLIYQTDSPEEHVLKIENGDISISESRINITKDAVLGLWEEKVFITYTICGEMYEYE